MHLKFLKSNLQKRREKSGLEFVLGDGASENDLELASRRLGLALPDQVRMFYATYDGLTIACPCFEILPIDQLDCDEDSLIHFATADKMHAICLDCGRINVAGQWDVLCPVDGYVITHTFASFWSNKIWKWIDREIPFWRQDWLSFT